MNLFKFLLIPLNSRGWLSVWSDFCSVGFVIRPKRVSAFSMRQNNKKQINAIPKCGALSMCRIINPYAHSGWIANPAEQKFLTLICKVATLSLREEYYFFVSPNENIGQHDSPTEPRGVKKINGENVKKALVPWYATGCLTIAWHFNAFSERH